MKNAFRTTFGSHFETKLLDYKDNLCRMTIHEKTFLFLNLQRLFGCTLTSTEKPCFCHFGLIFFLIVNANACSNISVTIPASFDTISTKISQFCNFNRSEAWLNVRCCVFGFRKCNLRNCGLIFSEISILVGENMSGVIIYEKTLHFIMRNVDKMLR